MTKRSRTEVSEMLGVPMRGDIARWEEFLRQVDYKPGWQFSIVDLISQKGAIAVRFKMLVWDTIEARDLKPIVVTTDYQVPQTLLGREFSNSNALDWLRKQIHKIECHEADEWLRFDGMQCFNPHGESQMLGRRPEGWEWICPQEIAIAPTLKEKQRGPQKH